MTATKSRLASERLAVVKVGIVGAPAFSRECLVARLTAEPDLAALDLGTGGPGFTERVRISRPTLVLVDLPCMDACALAKALLRTVPGIRSIIVHRSNVIDELVALAEAGYIGFVSADASLPDLLRELCATIREEVHLPPRLIGALLRSLRDRQPAGAARSDDHLDILSRREREVALLLERRLTNKEIASELGIEFGTVKNHVHNVLTKLGVPNRWEIPRLAGKRSQ